MTIDKRQCLKCGKSFTAKGQSRICVKCRMAISDGLVAAGECPHGADTQPECPKCSSPDEIGKEKHMKRRDARRFIEKVAALYDGDGTAYMSRDEIASVLGGLIAEARKLLADQSGSPVGAPKGTPEGGTRTVQPEEVEG